MYVCDCFLSMYFEFIFFDSSIVGYIRQNDLSHLTIYQMQFKEIVTFRFNLKNKILYKILKSHLPLCCSFFISLQRWFSGGLNTPIRYTIVKFQVCRYQKFQKFQDFKKKKYYPVKIY